MPNIRELSTLIDLIPPDQAIMLESPHGMGKSEVVRQLLEKKGYRVVVKFAGQMADAGDLIGLPDRIDMVDATGKTSRVTSFCQPEWWPTDMNEKVAIILDETNRGKPEIMQCLMDMVLNRVLNGRPLPEQTRIFACINPSDDVHNYDVQEMNSAFLSRFRKFEFYPDVEEWLEYMAEKRAGNKFVLSYITKHRQDLDPPDPTKMKADKVYPCRRSWTALSDTLNKSPTLITADLTMLKTMMLGYVGVDVTASFAQHVTEMRKNVSATTIIHKWDDTVKQQVESLSAQEQIFINKEIALWFDENEKALGAVSRQEAALWANNVERYLNTVPADVMAQFVDVMASSNSANKKWVRKLFELNSNINRRFMDIFTKNQTFRK